MKAFRLCIALLLLTPHYVGAVTIQTSICEFDPSKECITTINGLIVGNSHYNVEILVGTFDELFLNPAQDLTYWGQNDLGGLAHTYAGAIVDSLNELVPQITSNGYLFNSLPSNSYIEEFLHLPTEYVADHGVIDTTAFRSWCPRLNTYSVDSMGCSHFSTNSQHAFAVLSEVPLPGSIMFFGGAVASLIFTKMRRASSRLQ